ncbi:MAG: putative Ribokinase [Parcubacteria group bacterium Gr01-1014_66]|nr:MAG: putative Ribokinase [Parcubacteria group bacterium Gr01-1014_66]
MRQTPYFIAIGDVVTDAFIRLEEASIHCTTHRERCEICMPFADKVPYKEVFVVPAVGNSANAAVAATRLGLSSALVSNIGDDYFGQESIAALEAEKVGTEFVKIHKGGKTNYHYVLWYQDDRTILVKHELYAYSLPDFPQPQWIYLSSLGEHAASLHPVIEEYLKMHEEVKLAFQPGTFQMRMGVDALRGIYARSELFFCNKDEAQRILQTEEDDIKKLLHEIRALGPRIAVITDGVKGAYADDGVDQWFMPPYPDPKPPLERTGAGDAFSSTFTVAIALGLPPAYALRWAPINSMSVVQYVGAREGLLTREKLEEWLAKAPTDYQPQHL